MSNSPLVNYTKISPNKNSPRLKPIKKITVHHMAGNLSVETVGNIFASSTRDASSTYGIGTDGRVGMYVEEKDRAWTSSNADNDHQAITIEVANDGGAPDWHVSDTALNKLIDLCVDICKRNGIKSLNYTGDKTGNLTRHNMFAATACPGPYLQSKFPYIAAEVNKRLAVTGAITHIVAKGETLYSIGKKYNVSHLTIQAINGISDPKSLSVGQKLIIPANVSAPTADTEIARLRKELDLANARADGLQIQLNQESNAHAKSIDRLNLLEVKAKELMNLFA